MAKIVVVRASTPKVTKLSPVAPATPKSIKNPDPPIATLSTTRWW